MNISKNVTINDIKQVFEGELPDYHPESFFKSRINDDMAFIATNDKSEAMGFLMYNIWWGNCPFIELLKVREQYQRDGVGLALLQSAKDEIKSKGFKTVISSTEVINPLGLGFHDKAGFEKINSLALQHGEEQFYIMNLNE